MRLDLYDLSRFDRGAPRWKEMLWFVFGNLLLSSWLPGSSWRRSLLTAFGAKIGEGAVLKPRMKVKFPWRLEIGNHAWIGEDVWIDNLAKVKIGDHACLSQGAYLCTGSHDWTREDFDLITLPIVIGNHAWLGAKATLAPGAIMGEGTVLAMSGFGRGKMANWTIYAGNPASENGPRLLLN